MAGPVDLKHNLLRLHWEICPRRDRRAEAELDKRAVVLRLRRQKPGCTHRQDTDP